MTRFQGLLIAAAIALCGTVSADEVTVALLGDGPGVKPGVSLEALLGGEAKGVGVFALRRQPVTLGWQPVSVGGQSIPIGR